MPNDKDRMFENASKKRISTEAFDNRTVMYDILFILNVNSKGWILEKIAKVIESYSDLRCGFLYSERNDRITQPIYRAYNYFYLHYSLAATAFTKYPEVFGGRNYVWFTHFDKDKNIKIEDLGKLLSLCSTVFCPSNLQKNMLIKDAGLEPMNVVVPLGGAEPEAFRSHARGGGKVGFVGAYYARKSPEKMLACIRAMPDVEFLLVGPHADEVVNAGMLWSNWAGFDEFRALPNLTYTEAMYADFPKYYEQIDVLVSLATLEGGPIPLVEAMMSNVVPVATRTGFAEDVIKDGMTGHVLDFDMSVETVVQKIRLALSDKTTDIRTPALIYSWQQFAKTITASMKPTLEHTEHTEPKSQPGTNAPEIELAHLYCFGSDPINAKVAIDGKVFLEGDWHRADKSGIWSGKEASRITFALPAPGTRLFVAVRVVGASPERPIGISVQTEHGRREDWSFWNDKNYIKEINIEPASEGAQDVCAVIFKAEPYTIPAELGLSKDSRHLGLMLKAMIAVNSLVDVKPILRWEAGDPYSSLKVA